MTSTSASGSVYSAVAVVVVVVVVVVAVVVVAVVAVVAVVRAILFSLSSQLTTIKRELLLLLVILAKELLD